MRKLLLILALVAATPFLLFALVLFAVRLHVSSEGTLVHSYNVQPDGRLSEVPLPPGYGQAPPTMSYGGPPTVVWAKLMVMALIGGIVMVGAVICGALILRARSRPGPEGMQLAGGIEQLLTSVERMDDRIGNLETILIERRR